MRSATQKIMALSEENARLLSSKHSSKSDDDNTSGRDIDWEKKYLGASEEVKTLRESLMRAEAEVRVEKAAGTEAKASLKPLNKQVKRLQQTVLVSHVIRVRNVFQ